jgi:hypothetical protein
VPLHRCPACNIPLTTREASELSCPVCGKPLASGGAARASTSKPRRRNVAGRICRWLGAFLLIVAGVLTASSLVGGEDSRGRAHVPISVRLALAAAGILLYFPGRALYRRGKKLSAISAGDLLKADTRAPVLYLRAFKDDPVASQTPSTNYAQLFGVIHAEEEQSRKSLPRWGRLSPWGGLASRCPNWAPQECTSPTMTGNKR